jgi:polysaccharide lyase-like protein
VTLRNRGPVALLGVLAVLLAACSGTAGGGPPAGEGGGPAAAPVPAAEGLLWSGDLETGDLSQFQDTPQNVVGGEQPQVVQSPVRHGAHAVELTIRGTSGSADGICCGSRSEIQPRFRDLVPGDDLWFGFSSYLAPGFPTDAYWQVITQFKQNFDGSPPLELNVEEGQYKLEGGQGHPDGNKVFVQPLAEATTGVWVDWVLHVKFSADPAVGFVEVWKDGRQVLDRYSPQGGTLYPGPDGNDASYVKTGYYRDAEIDRPGSIYFDDWRIGTSRFAVTTGPDEPTS